MEISIPDVTTLWGPSEHICSFYPNTACRSLETLIRSSEFLQTLYPSASSLCGMAFGLIPILAAPSKIPPI